MSAIDELRAERLAQSFHETYERLAPSFGYETRKESAVAWADVPEQNRNLMTAVCAVILTQLAALENAQPAEGTWAWALEQMKDGKMVHRASLPMDVRRINRATGLIVSPETELLFRDIAALIFADDFEATDWQLAPTKQE